jgi:hypothetical protein
LDGIPRLNFQIKDRKLMADVQMIPSAFTILAPIHINNVEKDKHEEESDNDSGSHYNLPIPLRL